MGYAIFEHNFKVREGDEQRTFFSLPPVISPLKCSLLPLSNNTDFTPLVQRISQELTMHDISHRVDDSSGSIGKRYARTDEGAVPYGMTVDFDSLKEPHTVTLRERDSTTQIRIGVEEVAEVVRQLATGRTTWTEVTQKFPKFEAQESKSTEPVPPSPPMFPVNTAAGLEALETYIATRSYLEGHHISSADYLQARELIRVLAGRPMDEKKINTRRWLSHIQSYM